MHLRDCLRFPEQVLLIGGATTNYAHRRDADVFLPAAEGEEEGPAEGCLGRLSAPPVDAENVLRKYTEQRPPRIDFQGQF